MTAEKGTKKRAARAELLFCLVFNLYCFFDVLAAAAVVTSFKLLNGKRKARSTKHDIYLPISGLLRSLIDGPNKMEF